MVAKFVSEEGALKGLTLSLEDGNQWVIGRDPDVCQLLVEDPSVSRTHLMCRASSGGITVENLSTTNPTTVNNEEIHGPHLLQDGDNVKIGDEIFRFYADQNSQVSQVTDENNPAHENIATQAFTDGEGTPNSDEEQNSSIKEVPNSDQEHIDKPEEGHKEQEEEVNKQPNEPIKESNLKPPVIESPSTADQELHQENPHEEVQEEERHDSIFDEGTSHDLAEINFNILDTGKWLLKVINGPNNGAEFPMQTGAVYTIGTDPNACDIVFHDTSVSRQHARISITQDDHIFIEDLKSRNGTNVDGVPLKDKQPLSPNSIVAVGTTSFVVFDREGTMQTIISPLMPAIVKTLTEDTKATESEASGAAATAATTQEPIVHHSTTLGAFILIGILTGIFIVVGIGVSTLFKSEPVITAQAIDPIKALDAALAPFPTVKYTFNKNTGQLLLIGHVLTNSDRSQLLYALKGMNFIKSLDDSDIVIDEGVWREINMVIEKNPEWKAINIMAPTPGHFILSGYLHTRAQFDSLMEYLSNNFAYPELLEKRVVVDEDVVAAISVLLQNNGFNNVTVKLDTGEITLGGTIQSGKTPDFLKLIPQIREIRGVRTILNIVKEVAPEQSIINISDKYEVTGISNQGGNWSVVINGRILMVGDILDGMTITTIQPNTVFLEKDGTKYRIDFS